MVPAAPGCTSNAGLDEQVPADLGRAVQRRQRLRLLALLALAAGEVEVRVELAALAGELRALQHEPVRLEQVAQVVVGKRAGMARVASPLEAVQLARDERIDGRNLIDDEDVSPGPGHARQLRHRELRSRNVVQGADRAGEVERP